MPYAGHKRVERDIYSPNTGKKYVDSPEHQRARVDDRGTRRNVKVSQLSTKLTRLPDAPWSKDEDEKLIKGAVTNDCNWKKVQAILPSRSMDQCQLRWQQIGANRIGDQWTNAEDRVLTELVMSSDDISWSQITDALLSRTGALRLVRQCRDRWGLVLEPRMKQRENENARHQESTDSLADSPLEDSETEDENDDDVSPAHIQLNSPRWEDLPSVGSAGHAHGLCKRCCFFPKGRCLNGYACNFCHFSHEKRIRKNKHKNRQNRDRVRSHRQGDDWQSQDWFNEDDWKSQEAPHGLPVFRTECGVHFNMPGEVSSILQCSVAPTCLPCMPPVHEGSPFDFPQESTVSAGASIDAPVFDNISGQGNLQDAALQSLNSSFSETLPVQQSLGQDTATTSEAPTECLGNSNEKENMSEDNDQVWVWLDGMDAEYQFTLEDLHGFFGSYGDVCDVKLHKGGGGSIKFASKGVAARVASDLDGVELPALGRILRVKLVAQ